MPYTGQHPFEPDPDGRYCIRPAWPADCAEAADHPVHAVDRPEVERLAYALASHAWFTDPGRPALVHMSEHRRHSHSSYCALCTGDVHRIAAAVLDFLAPGKPPTPSRPILDGPV